MAREPLGGEVERLVPARPARARRRCRRSGVVRRSGEYCVAQELVRAVAEKAPRHRVVADRPRARTTSPSSTVATMPQASGQSRLQTVLSCTARCYTRAARLRGRGHGRSEAGETGVVPGDDALELSVRGLSALIFRLFGQNAQQVLISAQHLELADVDAEPVARRRTVSARGRASGAARGTGT